MCETRKINCVPVPCPGDVERVEMISLKVFGSNGFIH